MSINNLDEFDDLLKSGADSFNISPRKTSFGEIATGIKGYQKARKLKNMIAFGLVVSVLYFSWFQAILVKPKISLSSRTKYIQKPTIAHSPSIFSNKNTSLKENSTLNLDVNNKLFKVDFKSPIVSDLNQQSESISTDLNPIYILPKKSILNKITKPFGSPNLYKIKKTKPANIKWTVFASTGYSFRKLNYVSNNINNPNSFTNTEGFDWKQHKAIAGVLFGISGTKYLNNKYYIKSGAQIYIGGYDIKNKFTTYNTTSVMSKVDANQNEVRSAYRICYLETPILAGVSKQYSSFKLNIDGGATLSTRIYESTPETVGLLGREYAVWNGKTKLINITLQATPSITYNFLGTQFNTGIELRYQITSTYIKAYPAKEHLYFVGLKTGITL